MAIKIKSNDNGSCILFEGSSQPAYWYSCLRAEVDGEDATRLNVINEVRTANFLGVTEYEFYKIPFTDFVDEEGNSFADAPATVQYINDRVNPSTTTGGTTFAQTEAMDFELDATNTTVMFSNGDTYGVNSIHATAADDGTITITTTKASVPLYSGLNHELMTIAGASAGTSLQQVVNALNAYFAVTPVAAGGSYVPTFETDDGVTVQGVSEEGTTPITGSPTHLLTTGSDTSSGHGARFWSTDTIDASGEYYTVKMTGQGRFILALSDVNDSAMQTALTNDSGNGHSGITWGLAVYDYGSYKAPWTTYGSGGLSYGPGWNSSTTVQMRYNTAVQAAFDNMDPVLFKVGINSQGYIAVWYWDEGRSNDWILCARRGQTTPAGTYRLVVKLWDQNCTLVETPKVHLLSENDAPTAIGNTNIDVFGEGVTGTLAGGISVPTVTDNNDGFISEQTITQLGEYFQFTWSIGDSKFGLFSENDHNVSTVQADTAAWGDDEYIFWGARAENNGEVSSLYREFASTYQTVNATAGAFYGRVGFDTVGRPTVWASSDGSSWVVVHRAESAAPSGDYKFIWIAQNDDANLDSLSQGQISLAPTLTYHFIESPDGNFAYPLFATASEAEYYATQQGGSAASSQQIFVDDTTPGRVWHSPGTGYTNNGTSRPADTSEITYNEITTQADNLFAPAQLTLNNHTLNENAAANIQITPQDSAPATVTGLPPGLQYNLGFITGTTGYVPANTTYTVTVERSNAYGTTTQTFDITIQDNASLGDISGFSETGGNLVQPNRIILTHDALLQYDTVLSQGQQMTYSYTSVPPTIGILSAAGAANLAAFDPATDTLGTVNDQNNFAQTNQWDLRYVSFGGYIGGNSTKYNLVGWSDNTTQTGSEGTLTNQEFKLEYGNDGYIRLYVGGVLKLTSASTFTGDQTLTFAAFDDQAQSDVYIPANLTITNIGAGSTVPPTGFVNPLITGQMASTTLLGDNAGVEDAAVQLTEALAINHRYIFPQTWVEANVLPYMTEGPDEVFFGVPEVGVSWTDVGSADWAVGVKLEGRTSASHHSKLLLAGVEDSSVTINSETDAFYDYALEWDGTDLHVIACNLNDINTQPGVSNGGSFSRVASDTGYTDQTGALSVVIGVDGGGQANLTTSGLQHIRIPFGARDIIVGEASGGGSMFALAPAATIYDAASNGHASTTIGMSFDPPTLSAGYTYRFIYHPSMEAGDDIKFTRVDDGTDYTTGVTFFDGTSNGDPNFTEGYKGVEFAVPSDAPPLNVAYNNNYQGNTNYVLKPLPISGSTYVVPVTGVTLEGPAANQTGNNLFDTGDHGWISIDEQLSAGERFIMDSTFIGDLVDAMPDDSDMYIGLKSGTWTDAYSANFIGATYLYIARYDTNNVRLRIYGANGLYTSMWSTTVAGAAYFGAFIEVTNSGNNVRIGIQHDTSFPYSLTSTAYADWGTALKFQTGDQGYGITSVDVMVLASGNLAGNLAGMDSADVDWTALSEVNVPTPAVTNDTNWTKALDFSGSSERAQQVDSGNNFAPIRMGGLSRLAAAPTTAGYTSNDINARPWACAIVFRADGNSSNQHIWNQGEGSGSTDDNIYLRLSSARRLYFGWGRSGDLNELYIGTITANRWYGIYVGHNGTRLSGANATSGNLAAAFDVKLMSDVDGFTALSDQGSQAEWGNVSSNLYSTLGGRMDRSITGNFTIGGRGSNRNFHGKIASMVVTTLNRNAAMPTDAEIKTMITDPVKWVTDYKVGNSYRPPQNSSSLSNFQRNSSTPAYSTQVWLMGDGTNDGYAQIRNWIYPAIQNVYPLNMISMVSNDIQTVTINGLT